MCTAHAHVCFGPKADILRSGNDVRFLPKSGRLHRVLKHSNVPPDLTTMSIPSACPKSFVSNDAMVEAFNEWANEHLEKWPTNARTGVMQAMSDTWPCP